MYKNHQYWHRQQYHKCPRQHMILSLLGYQNFQLIREESKIENTLTKLPIVSSKDKVEQHMVLCRRFRNSLYQLIHDDGT